jgi:hypothetical protein
MLAVRSKTSERFVKSPPVIVAAPRPNSRARPSCWRSTGPFIRASRGSYQQIRLDAGIDHPADADVDDRDGVPGDPTAAWIGGGEVRSDRGQTTWAIEIAATPCHPGPPFQPHARRACRCHISVPPFVMTVTAWPVRGLAQPESDRSPVAQVGIERCVTTIGGRRDCFGAVAAGPGLLQFGVVLLLFSAAYRTQVRLCQRLTSLGKPPRRFSDRGRKVLDQVTRQLIFCGALSKVSLS